MLLVCIGDSLTFGYGVPSSKCWVSLLRSCSDSNIINKGINGNTTAAMLDRFYDDVISIRPTHVTILSGTNDFILNLKERYIFENIVLMCKDALRNNIQPILVSPIPIYADMAVKHWSASLNYSEINANLSSFSQTLKNYCEDNSLNFIDIFSYFESFKNQFASMYTDGLHPNELGHEIIKNCFQEELRKLGITD